VTSGARHTDPPAFGETSDLLRSGAGSAEAGRRAATAASAHAGDDSLDLIFQPGVKEERWPVLAVLERSINWLKVQSVFVTKPIADVSSAAADSPVQATAVIIPAIKRCFLLFVLCAELLQQRRASRQRRGA